MKNLGIGPGGYGVLDLVESLSKNFFNPHSANDDKKTVRKGFMM